MADSKQPVDGGKDEALEERIDAMMDPRPEKEPEPTAVKADAPTDQPLPPLDIFGGAQSAPEVPHDLLKQIGIEPTAKEETEDTTVSADESATDAAIDDIIAEEATEPPDKTNKPKETTPPPHDVKPIKAPSEGTPWFKRWWLWLVLALLIVVGLLAAPMTRYKLLGLVIKKDFSIIVLDSTNAKPISRAEVGLDGQSVLTDANGHAKLHVPVGDATLSISKRYYKAQEQAVKVPLATVRDPYQVKLVATGRQVPITVVDKLTGKGIDGAVVGVLDTSAKTDKDGKTTIVLPADAKTDKASVRANGYNELATTVQVTSETVPANTLALTPAGHIYFLSNQSGKIDVVKTNLDGSGRQVVMSGTGNEDNSTLLLAARDWRYGVLIAKRDSPSQQGLYLIDTATDQSTKIDAGDGSFTPVGWQGHYFIYDEVHNSVAQSQTAHEQLKSYNADTKQTTILDQTQVAGDNTNYAYQSFVSFNIVSGSIVYASVWNTSSYSTTSPLLSGKTNDVKGVQASGQGKQTYKTFDAGTNGYIATTVPKPGALLLAVYGYSSNTYTYYDLVNGSLKTDSQASQATFDKTYPSYLASPSGSKTLWSELRDGKHAAFLGDATAQNAKSLAGGGDYQAYGWYGENYVLLSKSSRELYIAPADPANNQQPLKISNYYDSTQAIIGYGGL